MPGEIPNSDRLACFPCLTTQFTINGTCQDCPIIGQIPNIGNSNFKFKHSPLDDHCLKVSVAQVLFLRYIKETKFCTHCATWWPIYALN